MILTLEVVGPQAAQLGGGSRKTFRSAGGVIGRDKTSDWVLPHTKVSGSHARITCVNGRFHIEDTSRNGVFLNSSSNRLTAGRPQTLKSGDRILIDPYEIRVSIANEPGDEVRPAFAQGSTARSPIGVYDPARPFDADAMFAEGSPPSPVLPPSLEAIASALPAEELDPLNLIGPVAKAPAVRKGRSAGDLEAGSPLGAHYRPPAIVSPPVPAPVSSSPLIPEDYDPLAPDPPERLASDESTSTPPPIAPAEKQIADAYPSTPKRLESAVTPLAEARPDQGPLVPVTGAGDGDLAEILAGAGLDSVAPTPELARSFGAILRVVVSGVMDILQARQQIKDEFRMRMTRFKVADNNPLKFSANVDDALHNLLVKHNDAYLDPVEAFEDAFRDLRHHQMALLVGMRVAFESMLTQFDPERLQEQFDRQIKRGQLLGMPARLRYWDLYRETREDMAKDPDARFRRLFGEEFAKAYEEQLELLKVKDPKKG
jgi:type VI secretion system FHA domain protein